MDLTIAYSLHGVDASSFDIGSSSGQVTVDGDIDYETKAEYNFTVRARDVNSRTDEVDIRITVSNIDEPPNTMFAPTLIEKTETSITFTYVTPTTTGPPVTAYKVRYTNQRTGNSVIEESTDIQATIYNLEPDTFYIIEVSAVNDEGEGNYSPGLDTSTKDVSGTVTGSRSFSLTSSIAVSTHGYSFEWSGALEVYSTYISGIAGYLREFNVTVNTVTET